MPDTLEWGHRYLMVRPDYFAIKYAINPFMDVTNQPDRAAAFAEWHAIGEALEDAGATVEVLAAAPGLPDMVYAMNLGFAYGAAPDRQVVLSEMRFEQRRGESAVARRWFEYAGFTPTHALRGSGVHFEAGDAFVFADAVVCGYGPRTNEAGLSELARALDVRVRGFRITHPGMYHLDLALCPLDQGTALVCPEAFAPEDAAALLDLVPDPIVLTAAEALEFAANSVVVGRTVIMPSCPTWIRADLQRRGFDVVVVPTPEFAKGGGSVRCLTSPLDLTLAAAHPGAEVVTVPAP